MANRVRWDQYEAAILLDAYVKYIDGLLTRSQAIEKVSTLLRKRALLAGEMIDSSYRNEAGTSFQLGVMQFAMTDGKKGMAQKSKLFQDTVKLYRTKPSEFALLLQTALTLSEDMDAATAASQREGKYVEYIGGTASFDKRAVESVQNEPKSDLPTVVQTAILEVVAAGFPNGVRLGSVIDRKKIGRLYRERTGEEPPNDEDTEACLASNGTLYDGKIYLIDGAARQEIRERLENECRRGNRILYYEELYKAAAEYYASKMIYSSDALKRVIEAAGARVVIYKNYCATTRDVTIEDELVRAFGPEVRLSVDELQRRLPFIPADKLTPSLSLSRRFVRVRAGEYARVDCIVIDENDVTDATVLVESEIAAHGFASLGNVDLTRTLANNPFFTETAIRDAFFIRVLADNYSKKGQIVTREGEAASANEVMRELCRSMDVATLEDLDEIEKTVTGQARNAILPIAFDAMVRVDRDTFVSYRQVSFDVAAVDEALAFFVGTGITPIKAITSFNSFPYVGRPWTLYLLESYLAHYSGSYTINGGPARSDNVGAIYPKDKKFGNYGEVLAQVLADSTLDLNGNDAADYLIKVGFVLRKTALVKTAMERARTFRDIRGR